MSEEVVAEQEKVKKRGYLNGIESVKRNAPNAKIEEKE